MIIASLGKLCVAQAITDADEISENVIQLPATDYVGITDVWWVVDTNVVAATAGTLKFELVLAQEAALTNVVQVACVDIAAITDKRVATAGRHIVAMNVGKMLKDMLDTDGSDYPFIGEKHTLSTSTTITINSSLSPTEPQTEMHRMATVSNVTIPAISSAGSGF
ncbi:MAG: hypothetical protein ACYSX1_01925 [Planctomycetota bacterium]|jgi:hypothetical protein